MPSSPSVEKGQGEEGTGDQQHGAPSGLLFSKTPPEMFSSALRDAARSTLKDDGSEISSSLSELVGLSPLKVCEELLGFAIHSPALENLFFIGTNGSKIGVSLSGFSSAWKIPPHRDAYYDPTLWNAIEAKKDGQKFTYERFNRALSLSLSECVGSTAPIRLLAYAGFLPRPVADVIKTTLLAKALSSDQTKLSLESDVLCWMHIQKLDFTPVVTDADGSSLAATSSSSTSEKLRLLYQKFVNACQSILDKAEVTLQEVQELELPNLRHPLYLLKRWASLPQSIEHGNSMVRTVEQERRIHARLASHSSGISLKWCTRRLLYGALLRATPIYDDADLGFVAFIDKIECSESGDPDTFMSDLSKLAKRSGYSTVDKFLKLGNKNSAFPQKHGKGPRYNQHSRKRPRHDQYSQSPSDSSSARSWFSPEASKGLLTTSELQSPSGAGNYSRRSATTTTITTSQPDNNRKQQLALASTSAKNPKKVTCYKCGQQGHYAYACPSRKDVKGNPPVKLSPRPDLSANSSSEGVTPSNAVSLQISHSLLTSHLRVLSNDPDGVDEVLRVALDTMSSVNLITASLSQRLGCLIKSDNTSLTSLGSKSSPGKVTTIKVFIPTRGVTELRCLVVSDEALKQSCDCDLLVGFQDLNRIGVKVTFPQYCAAIADLDTPLSTLVRIATNYLQSRVGNWTPLLGAPKFNGRLRPISTLDHADTPQQKWVFEVSWAANSQLPDGSHVHDFSVGLLEKLSPQQRSEFWGEIAKFRDNGWWFEVLPPDAEVISPAVCTFPVCQDPSKSTRVRPCSDCRVLNRTLFPSSYSGRTVGCIADIIRSRYRPHYDVWFLDLEKAFLKLHIEGNKVIRILVGNHVYFSNRILFGLKHGPSSLNSFVLLLFNACFSALLQRPIHEVTIDAFADLVDGLVVLNFYDDIVLMGEKPLVERMRQLLCSIAVLCGSNFPSSKCDNLRSISQPCRHLGLLWKIDNNRLVISCVKPDPFEFLSLQSGSKVCRRQAFSYAGRYYDPLRCHPMVRLGGDYLRHWFGKSPGGNRRRAWDRQWTLNQQQASAVSFALAFISKTSLGDCCHPTIPATHHCLVVHCDASSLGYGFAIHSVGDDESLWPELCDPSQVLLEACAGSFELREREKRWHINRKEAIVLYKACLAVEHWLSCFSPHAPQINQVILYSDNSSAVHWATQLTVGTKSYDRIVVERLIDLFSSLFSHIREKYGVQLDIRYIEGSKNQVADDLSRQASTFPSFPLLEEPQRSLVRPTSSRRSATTLVVSSDAYEFPTSNYKTWSSHRCLHPVWPAIIFLEDEEAPCSPPSASVLAVSQSQNPFTDLTALGNMTREDVIVNIQEALQDQEFCASVMLLRGVSLLSILKALGLYPEHSRDESSTKAHALCEGDRAFFSWDSEKKLLLFRDIKLSPLWFVYACTPRSQHWILYRFHYSPLLGCHRSAARCVSAALSDGWYFMRMPIILKKWIRSCRTCQLTKVGGRNPVQPYLFRRGAMRFQEVQLDLLGPLSDNTDSPEPTGAVYLVILVDSATQICMGCPAQSTSTLSVISALLQWIAVFGIPSRLQLDSPPSHASDSLHRFLSVLGIDRSLGVSRRPQTQGRVENVIKEIKTAVNCNAVSSPGRLPFWVTAQTAIAVHNSSKIGALGFSPNELAFGIDDPFLPSKSMLDDKYDLKVIADSWSNLRNQIADNFYISRAIADDNARHAEMVQQVHKYPLRTFAVGDQVRLCRLENNHRIIRGPFTVEKTHPTNPYLYQLLNWTGWVSLGQLLPFFSSDELQSFTHAVHPHEAYCSGLFSLSLPDDVRVEPDDAKAGDFVVVAEDDKSGPEPVRTLHIGEIVSKMPTGFSVVMLNKSRRGTWNLPPVRERSSFEWDVPLPDIVGIFHPTKTRRLPPQVVQWLQVHGAV